MNAIFAMNHHPLVMKNAEKVQQMEIPIITIAILMEIKIFILLKIVNAL